MFLPEPFDAYTPRRCDCDFCTTREISYLSDPSGSVEIVCKYPLKPISQGSEQAQFLSCPNCDCVVTVVYLFEDGLKGAVNARLIIAGDQLQEAEVVSPRLLSATEKIKRWNDIWFPVLVVNKN